MKIDEKLKKLIEKNVLTLSTVNSAQCPHSICVMFAKVINDNKILITDNYMQKTKENIFKNKNVVLSIFSDGEGIELIGNAKYFSSGEFVEKLKEIPENKECPCKGAILITVESIVKMF